jgi:hypothetical protein
VQVIDWCIETMLNILYYTNEKCYTEATTLLYQSIRVARSLVEYAMIIELNQILANFLVKLDQRSKALKVYHYLRDLAIDTYQLMRKLASK